MFNYTTVKNELEEIAKSNPDYVYPNMDCTYYNDDQPGCIVGHWFARHGITAETVDFAKVNEQDVAGAVSGLGIEIEPKALAFLSFLQARQDSRVPWGQAFDRAVADAEDAYDED